MQEMTLEERMLITDLNKCDFGELHAMHREKVEARKNMSKEEKLVCTSASTSEHFIKKTIRPVVYSEHCHPKVFDVISHFRHVLICI